jgi:hypothetical protein
LCANAAFLPSGETTRRAEGSGVSRAVALKAGLPAILARLGDSRSSMSSMRARTNALMAVPGSSKFASSSRRKRRLLSSGLWTPAKELVGSTRGCVGAGAAREGGGEGIATEGEKRSPSAEIRTLFPHEGHSTIRRRSTSAPGRCVRSAGKRTIASFLLWMANSEAAR